MIRKANYSEDLSTLQEDINQSLGQLRHLLRSTALTSNAEGSLQAAELLGRLNWSANDGHLSEDKFEARLTEKLADDILIKLRRSSSVSWLHVVSRTFDYGGHTALMLRIVEEFSKRGESQMVLITRDAAKSTIKALGDMKVDYKILGGELIERAQEITSFGMQAKSTILYIHPDDISAAISARLIAENGGTVLFVNHADHVFSYGPAASSVLLEVSAYGWQLSEARRDYIRHGYLGIPLTLPEIDVSASQKPRSFLSIGSPYKYQPREGYNFPDFLMKIINSCDIVVDLIGPTGLEPWWNDIISKNSEKVRFHGRKSFRQVENFLASADGYLDSFPVSGGTTFSQALGAGCAVFGTYGHDGGYGLADALRYSEKTDMIDAILRFVKDGSEPQRQSMIREKMRETSSASAVADRLMKASKGRLTFVPREIERPNYDLDLHVKYWRESEHFLFSLSDARSLRIASRTRIAKAILRKPFIARSPAGRSSLIQWVIKGKTSW